MNDLNNVSGYTVISAALEGRRKRGTLAQTLQRAAQLEAER
jgi:hypothetical protein